MKQLIKITEQNGNQVVSARELSEFLEAKTDFTTWCRRMFDYGFEEGEDYSLLKIGERKAHNKIDYALTLDCAKEISMLQRNDKGKQARKYFIEIDKKYKKIEAPTNPLDLLKLAVSEMEKKDKEIKYLKPKAEFMDKVMDADEKIDIGQAAKILELPFGRNTMFKKLRDKGVFFKNRNEPKQEYIKRKYFVLKEKYISRNNHDGFVVVKVLVTQKGLEYLSNIFNSVESNKSLAIIE
jgi:anti-repressor protein